jgi:hypothetical protein
MKVALDAYSMSLDIAPTVPIATGQEEPIAGAVLSRSTESVLYSKTRPGRVAISIRAASGQGASAFRRSD